MQKEGLETSQISFSLQKHLFNQYNNWLLRFKSSRESVLKFIKPLDYSQGMHLETEILAKMSIQETATLQTVSEEDFADLESKTVENTEILDSVGISEFDKGNFCMH
jgi:hypothetical protein